MKTGIEGGTHETNWNQGKMSKINQVSETLQKGLFHANLVLASKMRPDFQK